MNFNNVTNFTDDIRFLVEFPDWMCRKSSPVQSTSDHHQNQNNNHVSDNNQGQNQVQYQNQVQNQNQPASAGGYITDKIAHQMPDTEPLFTVKTGNQWMAEAFYKPDPEPLWDEFWHEGEVSCLFADSNLGKSIYAVQIAQTIAFTKRVIYFDFELTDKQFQQRYTDENGRQYTFPSNMLRAEIDVHKLAFEEDEDINGYIFDQIEQACVANDVKIVIIDNISFLCNSSDKGVTAGTLMMRLLDLKRRLGLSILILAHTPKRLLSAPISQNDLAGSKKIFNFSDSVFAIGKSAKDEELRYIKQLKVRAGKFKYDSGNVIIAEIVKDDAYLHFNYITHSTEKEHLRENKDGQDFELNKMVIEAVENGERYEDIAKRFSISKSKVFRIYSKRQTA